MRAVPVVPGRWRPPAAAARSTAGHGPVAEGVFRVGRHVLARHLGDDARLHAEEAADRVQRRRRLVHQVAVAEDADLLPGEQP